MAGAEPAWGQEAGVQTFLSGGAFGRVRSPRPLHQLCTGLGRLVETIRRHKSEREGAPDDLRCGAGVHLVLRTYLLKL